MRKCGAVPSVLGLIMASSESSITVLTRVINRHHVDNLHTLSTHSHSTSVGARSVVLNMYENLDVGSLYVLSGLADERGH